MTHRNVPNGWSARIAMRTRKIRSVRVQGTLLCSFAFQDARFFLLATRKEEKTPEIRHCGHRWVRGFARSYLHWDRPQASHTSVSFRTLSTMKDTRSTHQVSNIQTISSSQVQEAVELLRDSLKPLTGSEQLTAKLSTAMDDEQGNMKFISTVLEAALEVAKSVDLTTSTLFDESDDEMEASSSSSLD